MLYSLAGIPDPSFTVALTSFQYLTMRSILGVLTALIIALIVGPKMIRYLSSYNIGQSVRDDGPESHSFQGGHTNHGRRTDPGRHCC